MHERQVEVRQAGGKGRGVFAVQRIARGERLAAILGWHAKSDVLDESWFALQVAPDLWLCSDGDSLDDCINHSCEPNAGFTTGVPVLYALRDIEPSEEIGWDYSTSLSEPGWTLDCCCGAANRSRTDHRSWSQPVIRDHRRILL